MTDDSLPLVTEIERLKQQVAAVEVANAAQEKSLDALNKSDRHQYKLLRFQRQVQSGCIAALALAIAVGFAGFSSGNRETLERIVVGIVGAAAAGHVGSNFLDKTPDEEDKAE